MFDVDVSSSKPIQNPFASILYQISIEKGGNYPCPGKINPVITQCAFHMFNICSNYEHMIRIVPPSQKARGRGIVDNPDGRFERYRYEAFDDGWDLTEAERIARTQVRIERPRKIISRNTSPDLSFDRSINPYRGCEHGCVYCFARPSHAFLNLSPGLDFETQLLARPTAPDLLAKELSKAGYTPKPLAIGTNTDPYQPIEGKHQIMRGCLKVLRDFNHPVSITTKGALIERDIDILGPMAQRGLVRVGITVTTLDAKLSRALEPRVPAPKRLLQVIKTLSAAGIPVRAMISPVIPGLTDAEIEKLVQAAAKHGAVAARYAVLRFAA